MTSPPLLSHAIQHGRHWAILPEFADNAVAYLQDADYEAHLAEYHARSAAPTPIQGAVSPDDRPYRITNGVALIPIDGVMTRKPTSYGGTSTLRVQHAVRLAGRDQDVKALMLTFSSPGGSVNGLQELTDEVTRVAGIKPVHGFIPDGAFSAAYYVATGCTDLTIERTAQCGSLGTMMVLTDSSKAAAKEGIKVEVISTGPLKGQGTAGTVPSDEYKAMLQGHADAYGNFFWNAIRDGRGIPEKMREKVFTGAYWMAEEALSLGLVDRIGTLDDAMASLIEATAQEDDDQDGPAASVSFAFTSGNARVTQDVAAIAPTQPFYHAVEPVAPALAKADPVSAPGGEDRPSAGNQQAPTSGAENQKGKHPMSFRQTLMNKFGAKGFGSFVTALSGTTSEDPEVLAGLLSDKVEEQASALKAHDPLLAVAKAHGVTDTESFDALLARAQNGDRFLAEVKKEAKTEAVRAFGAESGPIVGASVENQNLVQALASRDAWRKMADQRVGIKEDGSAPTRQTAPNGTVAQSEDQPEKKASLWDRMDPADQAQAMKSCDLSTAEKKEAFAAKMYEKTPEAFKEAN